MSTTKKVIKSIFRGDQKKSENSKQKMLEMRFYFLIHYTWRRVCSTSAWYEENFNTKCPTSTEFSAAFYSRSRSFWWRGSETFFKTLWRKSIHGTSHFMMQKKHFCFLIKCKYLFCKGLTLSLGSISRLTDYEKSVLTSRPERCIIPRNSATGIWRNSFI